MDKMDETRINAAAAELNALIQTLIQRNINLAQDLASANERIIQQTEEKQNGDLHRNDNA